MYVALALGLLDGLVLDHDRAQSPGPVACSDSGVHPCDSLGADEHDKNFAGFLGRLGPAACSAHPYQWIGCAEFQGIWSPTARASSRLLAVLPPTLSRTSNCSRFRRVGSLYG